MSSGAGFAECQLNRNVRARTAHVWHGTWDNGLSYMMRCGLCQAVMCCVMFVAGELIQSLLAHEQAAVIDALEGQQQQPEQPEIKQQLLQQIKV